MEYKAGYKNLIVWPKADEPCFLTYKVTMNYPKDELFGLVSQMRRCAVSIPANVVEGYGRRTSKDKMQFYYISRGSLNELEYYIDISYRFKYISEEEYKTLIYLREEVGKLLNGFIKSLK